MLRWTIRLAVLTVLGMLVYLAVTFVQVLQVSRRDEAREAQAIIVFGAAQYGGKPSPVLRARLDHVAALYKRGLAPVVMVTGGSQPGDDTTEASASATYLTGKGVPEEALLRETQGRTSWQSLAAAARILKARGLTRVLLVSDGFHALRVRVMAEELGLKAFTSPTRNSPIHGMAKLPYVAKETVAVAAGRILGFRRAAGIDERVRQSVPSVPSPRVEPLI